MTSTAVEPTLDTKDSRATLVEHALQERQSSGTPHPQSPTSPFSASFDPNASPPFTPNSVAVVPIIRPIPQRTPEAWSDTVSASLSHLASQFAAASQALASLPLPSIDTDDESTTSISGISAVQQAQARLEQELESLREQVAALGERRAEKEKQREGQILTDDAYHEQMELRFLGIEKKLDDLAETIRLDQGRLYARLQNSTITSNKQTLFVLPMANGKTPQNFPATKGEFEHLTKERYELLLKSYGVSIKGDTAAKRQTLREFIGLSPPSAK